MGREYVAFLEHHDHTGMYRLYAKIKIESRKSSIQMRWVAMHLHINENARRNSSVTVSCCEYYSCMVSLLSMHVVISTYFQQFITEREARRQYDGKGKMIACRVSSE